MPSERDSLLLPLYQQQAALINNPYTRRSFFSEDLHHMAPSVYRSLTHGISITVDPSVLQMCLLAFTGWRKRRYLKTSTALFSLLKEDWAVAIPKYRAFLQIIQPLHGQKTVPSAPVLGRPARNADSDSDTDDSDREEGEPARNADGEHDSDNSDNEEEDSSGRDDDDVVYI
ncbi:hypothetical protein FISHEDRAFT_74084 [Fistulina hepatica ATCC 64428]|uniref:Uncharacterized protein n=1 Tax=Fistulina hepatica ATCC 64428 TaxID=1128425 RepID=A0A0D7AAZ8_9AGAR|nr:hypothetical protein FISHEDRAFT_74084 [Fistulina hepatica ATCC 64428]